MRRGGNYFLSERARRGFLRLAVGRVMAPTFTALSNAEWTPASSLAASSFLPVATVARNCFSVRRRRDLTALFWRFLRWLLRIRRSADFVLGIDSFKYFAKEPEKLAKRAGKSTLKNHSRGRRPNVRRHDEDLLSQFRSLTFRHGLIARPVAHRIHPFAQADRKSVV